MEERRVLESWKAIAAYVGRTEKTCRKWEHELGLPVHRLDKSAKAHVFAYADELDRWKAEKLQAEKARKAGGFFGLSGLSRQTRFWIITVFGFVFLVFIGLLIRQITIKAPPSDAQSAKRVAILPLVDLSPDKEYEYLCDGMADTLISALGNVEGLRVPARSSAHFFKGRKAGLEEIGKKLKVEYILEASVQVEGDRLRVIPRLMSVADGYVLWSEKYDRSRDDIFAIQDEIARALIKTLKIKLLGQEGERIIKSYTADREAYNLYLKGRFLWEKRIKEDILKAIDLFHQAIDRDPAYALAHVGMADCYQVLATNRFMPAKETFPKGKAAALKAIEIDRNLAEAHATLGIMLLYFERNFPEAEEEFKEAIRINPAYANAHHLYATYLSVLGHPEEAKKEILLARELDPLSPRINANVGGALFNARQYEQALVELNKASELFPEDWGIMVYTLYVYGFLGQPKKGIQTALEYNRRYGPNYFVDNDCLTFLYARAGNREEARRRLKSTIEATKNEYLSPTMVAELSSALGDKEEALKWLDRAWAEEDPRLVHLKVSPFYDPLRNDPRFKDLLRRIGLEK